MSESVDQDDHPPDLLGVVASGVGADFSGGRWWVTSVACWPGLIGVNFTVWARDPSFPSTGGSHVAWHVALVDDLDNIYRMGGHFFIGQAPFHGSIPEAVRVLTLSLYRSPFVGLPKNQPNQPNQPISSLSVSLT